MERTLSATRQQRGFALIASVFLIIVLGLAAAFMVRLSGTIQTSQSHTILAQRAKQAANAGIEYGIYRVVWGADVAAQCPASTLITLTSYSQFTVTVTCSVKTYVGGDRFFTISSIAEYGAKGTQDYVVRKFETVLER